MTEALLAVSIVLGAATLAVAIAAWRRAGAGRLAPQLEEVGARLNVLSELQERGERAARAEAKGLREEVAVQVDKFGEASVRSVAALASQLSQRLGEVGAEIAALTKSNEERLERLR